MKCKRAINQQSLSTFPLKPFTPLDCSVVEYFLISTSVTGTHHPDGPSILPSCIPFSVESNFTRTGPGSSDSAAIYSNFWDLDLLVIDLIGTSAAAVPAAKTSENERSSSYLIYM